MKLVRIKLGEPANSQSVSGFRSLHAGFEYHFRSEWTLEEELRDSTATSTYPLERGFAPFVCAGPNGSGKSNLLEALAAIFFQLEVLRVRRQFLPDNFPQALDDISEQNEQHKDLETAPTDYELDYLIKLPPSYRTKTNPLFAEVHIRKVAGESPRIIWHNHQQFDLDKQDQERLYQQQGLAGEKERDILLPEYILAYSSGENEILSLPFLKMRFIQFDEYWHSLREQLPYAGRPETRMAYMDSAFSQAILLCNLLYHDSNTLAPFQEEMGLGDIQEFRIIIKRTVTITPQQAETFGGSEHPAIIYDDVSNTFSLKITTLLEADEQSSSNFLPLITRLKRCATLHFVDKSADTLYLDYCVNKATKQAFAQYFGFEQKGSAIEFFQAFQVLLTLNFYTVSDVLKTDLYRSNSLYINETIPTLASDERIMRFKHFMLDKQDVGDRTLLKSL